MIRAPPLEGPIVALSGTPGTGKTSVATWLAQAGHGVLPLSRFVGDPRFDLGGDPEREGTMVLDDGALSEHLRTHLHEELDPKTTTPPVFIESHFAHVLTFVDRIVVLRCRPSVLKKRLEARGYDEGKIRENMEAEGMDLILQEAVAVRDEELENGHTIHLAETDTSHNSVEQTAREVLRLATTDPANLEIGRLDWSDEVLGWY